MYSRAERKFLIPDPDHANPILGPGRYNPENIGQVWGKDSKKIGYAPFSSLSPRISTFDSIIKYTPAPGAYEAPSLPFHRGDRSSFFGRSKANRFDSKFGDTPGPGSYVLPSSLKLRSSSGVASGSKSNAQSNRLTQQPILITDREVENLNINDLQSSGEIIDANQISEAQFTNLSIDSFQSSGGAKKMHVVAKQVQGVLSFAENNRKKSANGKKIIWKRKHVPPSIPIGQSSFGYTDNNEGELIPRKPPVAPQYTEPSYLISFAEESKHSNRGYKFGGGQGRLTFKPHPGPGPNVYDIDNPDHYLRQSNRGPAVFALAPCKRLTDEIVSDAVKKGIPGPGAYELKSRLAKTSAKTQKEVGFGGEVHKAQTQTETPGPGSYYPEYAENSRTISHKSSPFGSTVKRFEIVTSKSTEIPAPGSYELGDVCSLVSSVQRKSKYGSANPAIAFGSFTERFRSSPFMGDSGYNRAQNLHYDGKSLIEKEKESIQGKDTKITSLLKKGPANVQIGNVLLNAAQMHIPIFGTQTERFKDSSNSVPPPGSYNSDKAFERLINKGKIENISIMSSQQKQHDLYNSNHLCLIPVSETLPGPGEYDPSPLKKQIQTFKSSFASSIVRFPDAKNTRPGPGAYDLRNNSLHRKTFNVTLADCDLIG